MKTKLMFIAVLLMAFIALPAYAQEMAAPEAEALDVADQDMAEDDLMVTYGTVVSVALQQIVILEYDFDADADIEATYIIDEDTQLEEIESLDGLQVDDAVEIVYEEKEGVKKALVIKKEDFAMEGEEATEGMDETLDVGEAQENMEFPGEEAPAPDL